MEWNNFKALYSSYFRPLTERDGIEEWQGFVARIPERDAKLLMKAMGELAHIHAEKRLAGADPIAPRIPDLAVLLNRERDGLRRRSQFSRGNCPLCKGTRRLIAAEVHRRYKEQFPFPEALEKIPRKAFCGFVVWDCPDCAKSYGSSELADALRRNAVSDSIPTMELAPRIGTNAVELITPELPQQIADTFKDL